MKTFKETEYTVPTWILPVIINADYTGLTDEEEKEINSFLNDLPKIGYIQFPENIDDEKYFSSYNDVTSEAGNVIDIVYVQPDEFKYGVLWALDGPKIDVEFLKEKGTEFRGGAAEGFLWLSAYKQAKNAHMLRILNSDMKGKYSFVW